jgi:hypothetical protein
MEFLKAEHAEENLSFFEVFLFIIYKQMMVNSRQFILKKEVETIKKQDAKDLAKATQDLIASYLQPGVETEVNVSDNMKKYITTLATKEHTSTENNELLSYLERAQNEIFMIMALGSFPRYLKSDMYKEWESIQHNNNIAQAKT